MTHDHDMTVFAVPVNNAWCYRLTFVNEKKNELNNKCENARDVCMICLSFVSLRQSNGSKHSR